MYGRERSKLNEEIGGQTDSSGFGDYPSYILFILESGREGRMNRLAWQSHQEWSWDFIKYSSWLLLISGVLGLSLVRSTPKKSLIVEDSIPPYLDFKG